MGQVFLARQLRLKLSRSPSFAREDFISSPSNQEALWALDSWPGWHGRCLALVGPEGSGKTHLALAWARHVGAVQLDPPITDIGLEAAGPVLVENAETASSEILFHLINMAGAGGGLLLTSRLHPRAWPVELPDLRSRLNALQVAEIGPPDDELLKALLEKFFRERNIRPTDDVYPYLLHRIERSVRVARAIVEKLDERADAENRDITRALARNILESDEASPIDAGE